MELIKQNENYTVSDKTEMGWSINGNVSSDINGSLSFNVSVVSESGDHIGDFNYQRWPGDDNNINVNYTVKEVNRDDLVSYSDTLIDWILEQFN